MQQINIKKNTKKQLQNNARNMTGIFFNYNSEGFIFNNRILYHGRKKSLVEGRAAKMEEKPRRFEDQYEEKLYLLFKYTFLVHINVFYGPKLLQT